MTSGTHAARQWDIEAIRRDFPVLRREVNGVPLVYLDNAATSQKPVQVIAELTRYYRDYNANIHRGVHTLSQEATAAYETLKRQIHTQLVDRLDMNRVSEMDPRTLRDEIRTIVEHLCDTENPLLNRNERQRLVNEILDEVKAMASVGRRTAERAERVTTWWRRASGQ